MQPLILQRIFNTMINALKSEDKYLLKSADAEECGVSNLDEKQIQYILYRRLLKLRGVSFYMEDPYGKGNRKCDLTIYPKNGKIGIWIEIKTTGWCSEGEFKEWVTSDLRKIKRLKQHQKYLLVSSVENEEPEESKWNDYFKREIPGTEFVPNLFGFFKTKFTDGKHFQDAYYTLCLLKVI